MTPLNAEEVAWKLLLFFKDHGAKFENYANAQAMVTKTLDSYGNARVEEAAKIADENRPADHEASNGNCGYCPRCDFLCAGGDDCECCNIDYPELIATKIRALKTGSGRGEA